MIDRDEGERAGAGFRGVCVFEATSAPATERERERERERETEKERERERERETEKESEREREKEKKRADLLAAHPTAATCTRTAR